MRTRDYLRPEDMNPSLGPPPEADRRAEERTVRGHTWVDPYAWLRDPAYPTVSDEAVLQYVRQENAYFQAAFEPHHDLVDRIFTEIRGRIKEEDASVPVRDGEWWFQTRYSEGDEYPRHFRRAVGEEAWTLLLDEVQLASNHDYFQLGGMDMTDDGALLAYSIDTDGDERYRMRVRRLADPNQSDARPLPADELPEEIANTIGDPIWLPDGRTFLYIELSDEWRPSRVRSHLVGSDPTDDPILFEEKDTGFFVGVDLTQDRRFIAIDSADHVTSEVWLIPTQSSESEPILVSPRKANHEYEVDHAGGFFYIRTNDTHKNFRIARVADDVLLAGNASETQLWTDFIAPSDNAYIRGLTAFSTFLAVEQRGDAVDAVRIVDYGGEEHLLGFPEPIFRAGLGENPEADVNTVQVHYESMITPPTVFDYDVAARTLITRKVQKIPSGYDPADYRTERLHATARDGATVPVSIVYKRGFREKAPGFLHLTAYGAYGSGSLPTFSISRLSLLERGFAVAIAHVRGGDEMGYRWYEDGKLFKRTNTFTDFVDAARHLCTSGYTEPGRICASGGSAGGELMGAAVNIAGELFRAVVALVPFVDVLNTMLDESLPLTPTEWPEWGNPIEDEDAFEYIRSYSPYDNVEAKRYPPLLITAGLSDPRVTYWEPAKWAAKLRATKTDGNVLLLKTNMGAGHAGKSGRFEHLRETAEYLAFFLLAAGIKSGVDGT